MIADFCDPHPDEILYSVWARYSDHVRYPYKTQLLRELFGSTMARPVIDLPCYLQYFVEKLPPGNVEKLPPGNVYTVDYFIDHHTLLPFYGPFLPQERLNRVREQMTMGDAASINRISGSGTIGIHSPQWLRYCPICVEEDKTNFGECYWHRLHQVVGVEICPIHSTFLENSTILTRGRENGFGLYSAERSLNKTVTPRLATSSPFFNTLMDIASEARYLLEYPSEFLDACFSPGRYRALMGLRGFMTQRGKIRHEELLKAFTEYYSQELLTLLQCEIKPLSRLASVWLARIITEHHYVYHPLYHILTIKFLGYTLKQFSMQEIAMPTPFGCGPWLCLNPTCEYYQQRNIPTYHLSKARDRERVVGSFTCCTCGYTYARSVPNTANDDLVRKGRTLSFGHVWEAKLCELWLDSTVSLKDIANCLGVDRHTVCNQAAKLNLPARRNLSIVPKANKKERSWYREQWLATLEETPDETISQLKLRAAGIYIWLIRHDQEWLKSHGPAKAKGGRPQKSPSPIMDNQKQKADLSNDTCIAESVRAVANKLMNLSERPLKVTKTRILAQLPQIRWIMPVLQNKLPLTAQAFQDVVETQEMYTLRNIHWTLQQYLEERVYPTRWRFKERARLNKKILLVPAVHQAFEEAMALLVQFG